MHAVYEAPLAASSPESQEKSNLTNRLAGEKRRSRAADSPYTVFEVLGTRLTDSAKHALAAYGFDDFHEDRSGFTAIRREPVT